MILVFVTIPVRLPVIESSMYNEWSCEKNTTFTNNNTVCALNVIFAVSFYRAINLIASLGMNGFKLTGLGLQLA